MSERRNGSDDDRFKWTVAAATFVIALILVLGTIADLVD